MDPNLIFFSERFEGAKGKSVCFFGLRRIANDKDSIFVTKLGGLYLVGLFIFQEKKKRQEFWHPCFPLFFFFFIQRKKIYRLI